MRAEEINLLGLELRDQTARHLFQQRGGQDCHDTGRFGESRPWCKARSGMSHASAYADIDASPESRGNLRNG